MASRPLSPFEKLRQIADEKARVHGLARVQPGDVTIPGGTPPSLASLAPSAPTQPSTPRLPSVPTTSSAPSVPRDSRSERSRERLSKRQLNVTISAELVDSLTTFAYHHRRGLADVVEQAIWEYLDANWVVPRDASAPTSLAPLSLGTNQLMIDDDDDGWALLVRIYERATGNQFREGDRQFLEEVQQYGAKCVTLGVLLGRSRYGKRISSLRYFGGTVLEVAAWPPDKIEKGLRYHWAMFLQRIGGRL